FTHTPTTMIYTLALHDALPISIILEIAVLLSVSVFGTISGGGGNDIIPTILSCALLFAMGLQNALVTRVSGSVVRTTHLTGLFRSEEHTSELQSRENLVCRLLL